MKGIASFSRIARTAGILCIMLLVPRFGISQYVGDIAPENPIPGWNATFGEVISTLFDDAKPAVPDTDVYIGRFKVRPRWLGNVPAQTDQRAVLGERRFFLIAGLDQTKGTGNRLTYWILIATVDNESAMRANEAILAAFRPVKGKLSLVDVAFLPRSDQPRLSKKFKRKGAVEAVDVLSGDWPSKVESSHTIVGIGTNEMNVLLEPFRERQAMKCDRWVYEEADFTMTPTRIDIVVTMRSNEVATRKRPEIYWEKRFRHSYRWDGKHRRFRLATTQWKEQQTWFLATAPCGTANEFKNDTIPD